MQMHFQKKKNSNPIKNISVAEIFEMYNFLIHPDMYLSETS